MVTVGADTTFCTAFVGILCVSFLPHIYHSISITFFQKSQVITPSIFYISIASHILYFISCILLFVSFIFLSADFDIDTDNQISRNLRGISVLLMRFGEAFLVFVFIIRLKIVFHGTLYAVSQNVYVFLYILIIISVPIQIVMTAFILMNDYFKLAMYLGAINVLNELIISFTILYLFCNKLTRLLIANNKNVIIKIETSASQNIDNQIERVQRDLDLIKIMWSHSMLVTIICLSTTFTVIIAAIITSVGHQNQAFYIYSFAGLHLFIASFSLYLTFEFANNIFNCICGVCDSFWQKCCIKCINIRMMKKENKADISSASV